MKVLHINTTDTVGGAALAMFRLHKELNRQGCQSDLMVGRSDFGGSSNTISFHSMPFRKLNDKILDRIGNELNSTFRWEEICHRNSWHIPKTQIFKAADVINLHNLHGGYFNIRALMKLPAVIEAAGTYTTTCGLNSRTAFRRSHPVRNLVGRTCASITPVSPNPKRSASPAAGASFIHHFFRPDWP